MRHVKLYLILSVAMIVIVTGREIETLVEGEVPSGEHRLQWSAAGLASGVYLCRMQSAGFSETIKMLYEK